MAARAGLVSIYRPAVYPSSGLTAFADMTTLKMVPRHESLFTTILLTYHVL